MAITPILRVTYAHVAEPVEDLNGRLSYSCGFLIPKGDVATLDWFKKNVDAALQKGLEKGKFNAAIVKSPTFRNPIRDGDDYYAQKPEAGRECYVGHWFVSARSNAENIPGIVDRFAKPVTDRNIVYSGCYGRGDLSFYPYNKAGGVGVGVGLSNFMFVKDGERMDGRAGSAETAFAGVADPEEPSAAEQAFTGSDTDCGSESDMM